MAVVSGIPRDLIEPKITVPAAINRWRIRARIFRWYRALLGLERELAGVSDSAQREQLLKRLDEIERAVNQIKVPASFADLFYSLRTHIDFVRHLTDGGKTVDSRQSPPA